MQFSPYRQPRYGQRLVSQFTMSGNPVLNIASVDWTNSMVTFTEPHGLTSSQSILVVPNDVNLGSPLANIRSIPSEWNNASYSLNLVEFSTDPYKAKIVRANATTTDIPVNLTSIENNNNVDITKFHIEVLVAWEALWNEPVRTLRMRCYGLMRMYQYRYMTPVIRRATNVDANNVAYINTLSPAMPNNGNRFMTAGLQDFIIDNGIVPHMIMFDATSGWCEGRRVGYNTLVTDRGYESSAGNKGIIACHTDSEGIVGMKVSANNALFANGSIIQFFDLGGWSG